jgi:UDP-N-acetylglucosamine 2-epimerase (non-hydrolysing)
MKKNICFIAGTRPEIIKVAPVIHKFKSEGSDKYNTIFCTTGQHKTMAEQAMRMFDLVPDYNLNIMSENQTLNSISSKIFDLLPTFFEKINPDLVFIQGDTTTAAIAGLVAFNLHIPVAHIEAGLRTHRLDAPFPEELNRRIISNFSSFNFPPTLRAKNALLKENCNPDTLFITGNTVVDALKIVNEKYNLDELFMSKFNFSLPYILVTAHRRESFGSGFENICKAIADSAEQHPDIQYVYPVHMNPNVRIPVHSYLSSHKNIILIEPVSYIELLALLKNCIFCITDSGGIQEEAPSFNKYTVVLRDFTERMESIEIGLSELVGTDYNKVYASIENQILKQNTETVHPLNNPFGDGNASKVILDVIDKHFYS